MEPECEVGEGPVFFFESDESNGFLRQEFLSSFGSRNIEYNCNEQFYQAIKATFFRDNYELNMAIRSATDPKEQKTLGKHIKANDASQMQEWVTTGKLWKHWVWYRRLINGGSSTSSYHGCSVSEV